MNRQATKSDSPFHESIGFSRAVRTGRVVAVSGTAPIGKNGAVSADLGEQVRCSLEIIREALEKLGARMDHVTRTRLMLRDISRWEEAAKVHGEYFGKIQPATTFMGVSGLIDPKWQVEIDADAFIHDGGE